MKPPTGLTVIAILISALILATTLALALAIALKLAEAFTLADAFASVLTLALPPAPLDARLKQKTCDFSNLKSFSPETKHLKQKSNRSTFD